MKQNLFSIPFFFDKVDLSKISLIDKETKPTFQSGVQSSFNTHRIVKKETLTYLTKLIWKNIEGISKGSFSIEISEMWRNVYTKETGRMHEADCGTQRCEYVKSVLGYFKPRVTPKMTWLNKDGTCDFVYINRVKCPGHDKKYPEMINNRNGCYMTKKEDSEYERRGWTYVVIAGPFACPSDYVKG